MRALRCMGVAWLAIGIAGFLSPREARAQSLHLAELFAEQGRLDDARAEVSAWFEIRGQEASPTELQHALWLRARFAPDPAEGARELESFVRDYPAGPFTARALAWMAAAAADRGGEARAIELYTRVLRDFPESDRVAEARDWLERRGVVVAPPPVEERMPVPAVVAQADTAAAADPAQVGDTLGASPETAADSLAPPLEPPVDTAAAPPDLPMDTAAAPPDLPMDTAAAPMVSPADTAAPPSPAAADSASLPTPAPTEDTVVALPDSVPDVAVDTASATPSPAEAAPERPRGPMEGVPHGPPVPGAAQAGRWAVQIGAFRNPDGAAGLVVELRDAGFDARLIQVPLNDLLRVRIGRYETQDAAAVELGRVRQAGYDGGLVGDARSETVVER